MKKRPKKKKVTVPKQPKVDGEDWNTFTHRKSGPMKHKHDKRRKQKDSDPMEGWE